jgi:hypothetical protein
MVVAITVIIGSHSGAGVGDRGRKDVRMAAVVGCHGGDKYDRDLSFIGWIGGAGDIHVGGIFPEVDTDAVAFMFVDQRLYIPDG